MEELHELLVLRGRDASPGEGGAAREIVLAHEGATSRVVFVERLDAGFSPPEADGETVVLTLEVAGDPPEGIAVLDLLGRRVHGSGGIVLDSVREFCRKRGIRLEPGRWRYRGGLV